MPFYYCRFEKWYGCVFPSLFLRSCYIPKVAFVCYFNAPHNLYLVHFCNFKISFDNLPLSLQISEYVLNRKNHFTYHLGKLFFFLSNEFTVIIKKHHIGILNNYYITVCLRKLKLPRQLKI